MTTNVTNFKTSIDLSSVVAVEVKKDSCLHITCITRIFHTLSTPNGMSIGSYFTPYPPNAKNLTINI